MLISVQFQGYYAATPAVGYTILNPDGSVYQTRSTTGVTSDPAVAVAQFFWVNFDPVTVLPLPSVIKWDDDAGNLGYLVYNGASNSTVVVVSSDLACPC